MAWPFVGKDSFSRTTSIDHACPSLSIYICLGLFLVGRGTGGRGVDLINAEASGREDSWGLIDSALLWCVFLFLVTLFI